MAESLARHSWDSHKRRRKGALPWTWPPAAHAALAGQEPRVQAPAKPPVAPRGRRHFGGRARRRVGTPPARLPDDPQSHYERARGAFLFIEKVAFPILAFIVVLYLTRRR